MLAVDKFLGLLRFTPVIDGRSIRLPRLTEDIPMLAVRPLHIPIEWSVG